MGVVRRKGKWRLEKQDKGVYEVTYEDRPEAKIITSEYEPTGFMDERNDFSIQVREVEGFPEVKELFKQISQSSSSIDGFSTPAQRVNSITSSSSMELGEAEGTLSDLPPAGLFIVGTIISALSIQQAGLNISSPMFLIGVGFLLLPLAVVGFTYRVYSNEGGKEAFKFLVSADNEDSKNTGGEASDDTVEKTSPAPKKMKDEIYFERANQLCEWCDKRTDSPEVHHIEPRSEGGPNEYDNLIALCPTCHSSADKGGISKTKLRAKVSRQTEKWAKAD